MLSTYVHPPKRRFRGRTVSWQQKKRYPIRSIFRKYMVMRCPIRSGMTNLSSSAWLSVITGSIGNLLLIKCSSNVNGASNAYRIIGMITPWRKISPFFVKICCFWWLLNWFSWDLDVKIAISLSRCADKKETPRKDVSVKSDNRSKNYSKALQRRVIRVSETFIESRSSGDARPEQSEWSVCP